MIRILAGKIYRRAKRLFRVTNNLPVLCDSTLSKILYGCHKKQMLSNTESKKANPLFYNRQFVAHGRYEIHVPDNSLLLYQSVIDMGFKIIECDVMFTKDLVPVLCHDDSIKDYTKYTIGHDVNKKISKLTYSSLCQYNFSIEKESFLGITTFEEVIKLAKKEGVCVQIDLEKIYLGRKKYQILYDIVKKYDMLLNVIWEVLPSDLYSILLIDNSIILQLNHTWDLRSIEKMRFLQKTSTLVILSEWFPGIVKSDYTEVINMGHQNGFLMKCATLNDYDEALKMFSIGVDLITTDTLTNNQVIN